jgi:two-component system chemotaxis response regulator CheB
MDGLTFLKRIMQYKPIPTVIVSTIAKQGSEIRTKALATGAVAVIDKEELDLYRGREAAAKLLLPQLLRAARTVVRQRGGQSEGGPDGP